MSFARVVLALSSAFVLLAGVACLVAPESFTQQAGLPATASALTEIRAFYGGLQVGIGCFLIWCVRQRALTLAGLLLVGLAVGGAGIARAFGMLIDGAPTTFHLTNFAIEVVTVAVVAVAVSRHRLMDAHRSAV